VHAGQSGARAGHRGREREGRAARDADEGRPVVITGAVPEQVAAYKLIADQITVRLTSS
jgi:hypothetical protein